MTFGSDAGYLYQQARPLQVHELGSTVVIAPHPDDESLGCGGTIALLRQANIPVHVIFVSDGSMSHPHSKKYPVEKRIALRETEATEALQVLGVDSADAIFMRLPDSQVPALHQPGFDEAVALLQHYLQLLQPATLLVPWKRDPHKDHRATWQIVQAALVSYHYPVRVLQYFIWLWERSQPIDLPATEQQLIWKANIETVAALKKAAIMKHVSQVTMLIDDDPKGFILSPEVLAHFSGRYELFAEDLLR